MEGKKRSPHGRYRNVCVCDFPTVVTLRIGTCDTRTCAFHFHRRPAEPSNSVLRRTPKEGRKENGYSVNNCVFVGRGQRWGRRHHRRRFPTLYS